MYSILIETFSFLFFQDCPRPHKKNENDKKSPIILQLFKP